MNLFEKILNGIDIISVIGLGYVGMPLAIAFAKQVRVIGFDLNEAKIQLYKSGIDPTKEVGNEVIKHTTADFTSDERRLREAKFHIIAVPTPINLDKTPDLFPVEAASRTLARNLTKGSIVVYESTVYPGVTEDICVPILERESGLKSGVDFKIGYSPERTNPGDKVNRLEKIVKIVSAMDSDSLDIISKVYELVIDSGVYRASSIKVAEAAKVVENSQRDINIAFMNELAIVFDKMGIDTAEVVEAMNTKWNALRFYPGLVGGHCIGVDPYYFVYRAEVLGYHSQIILSGRKINDGMGEFIADAVIKNLILANKKVMGAKVAIMGVTFKENCPDSRNSKVFDIANKLKDYGVQMIYIDPIADKNEAEKEYAIKLFGMEAVNNCDCIVFAVAHNEFKQLSFEDIDKMYFNIDGEEKVLIDVKSIFNKKTVPDGYRYWRL